MTRQTRQAAMLLAAAFVLLVAFMAFRGEAGPPAAGGSLLTSRDGETIEITGAARAGGLSWDPSFSAADRAWVEAVIAQVRPEAAALIAEVDGLVTVRPMQPGQPEGVIGLASGGPDGLAIDLDLGRLDGDLAMERSSTVVHEFGHIVDYALIGDDLLAELDAGIPRGGTCGPVTDCDQPAERFADTFAKWALRGAFSAGSGYAVPTPVSIEGWGEPLGALSVSLPK